MDTQPQIKEVSIQSEQPKTSSFFRKNKFKSPLIALLVFLLLLTIGLLGLFVRKNALLEKKISSLTSSGDQETTDIQKSSTCPKIISVIKEDPARYFIACSNFVSAYENGEIISKWGTEQLVSSKINSMVKIGNTLYIGNEGVTSIDLDTGNIQRYDHDSGMVTKGATILAADGDKLWVGTFGDLYTLDTSTSKLLQVTDKITTNSIGVEDIIVTPKSVYILTQEAIVRYDKSGDLWEKYDETVFGIAPGTRSEGFRSQIVFTNNTVILLQPYLNEEVDRDKLWYIADNPNAKWQEFPEIMSRIYSDYPESRLRSRYISLVGYVDDGSVILRVDQYGDVAHYYANPTNKEVGISRTKYYDDYNKLSLEEKHRDFIDNILQQGIKK